MNYINNVRETSNQQEWSHKMGYIHMNLFPGEDILTKEIETWCGFIEKLPSEDDKSIMTKLLNDCYQYAVAINSHDHPFSTEPVIIGGIVITT
jgi:hypothetical protein